VPGGVPETYKQIKNPYKIRVYFYIGGAEEFENYFFLIRFTFIFQRFVILYFYLFLYIFRKSVPEVCLEYFINNR